MALISVRCDHVQGDFGYTVNYETQNKVKSLSGTLNAGELIIPTFVLRHPQFLVFVLELIELPINAAPARLRVPDVAQSSHPLPVRLLCSFCLRLLKFFRQLSFLQVFQILDNALILGAVCQVGLRQKSDQLAALLG